MHCGPVWLQLVEPVQHGGAIDDVAMGENAIFLPLFLGFAIFNVAERLWERTADGDSIRMEFAGLLYLYIPLGWSCVVLTPLFDAAFAGYKRGLSALSELVGHRGLHPSTVVLVI